LPPKSEARRKLGLPKEAFIAGVIGRLDPKKGQDILIQACDRVHQTGFPLHVFIVGDETQNEPTGYSAHVRDLAGRARIPNTIIFSPYLNAVEYAYAALDVFVLTSHSETYGMVTIEAMAAGLPVIATSSGGTPDIIHDNINGILVPPRQPRALSDALLRLIHDPQLALRLSDQARKDAIERYSHSRQCGLFEKLFEELETGWSRRDSAGSGIR
jgi:glycosyltransferase involved in cell wall biosynthesis